MNLQKELYTTEYVFGKHSGSSLVKHMLKQLGVTKDATFVENILKNVKKKTLTNEKDKIYNVIQEYYRTQLGINVHEMQDMLMLETATTEI